MKKIFYWCPFIDKVATIKAVIKSCESFKKYSKNKLPIIINAIGEFDDYENEIKRKGIKILKLSNKNYIKKFPKHGFFASRFLYIFIFLVSFRKLKKILNDEKPEYLVAHLITSLPIFLFLIFKFNTKLILRISGFPKLNFFRKAFWRISQRKIYLITTPTVDTKKYLIEEKIFNQNKLIVLYDPIISINEVNNKKKINISEDNLLNKKYFIAIGRLTEQKNFGLLIRAFSKFCMINDQYNLIIIGDGEQKNFLKKLSIDLKITKNIFFLGYKQNVFQYLNNANAFILSSKWEDPGFVLIEAASCKVPIISSSCPNGPTEFLESGKNGILFKNNDENDLVKKMQFFTQLDLKTKKTQTFKAFKNVNMFTLFSHYKKFNKYLI